LYFLRVLMLMCPTKTTLYWSIVF